jgi:transcriptional regulator with XRE-family HTH domain
MPHKIGNTARRRRHFIREWREFRGLSQEKLAELIGTTKASISRIENLKQGYTQEILEAMADELGTHPGVLLMRPPSRTEHETARLESLAVISSRAKRERPRLRAQKRI